MKSNYEKPTACFVGLTQLDIFMASGETMKPFYDGWLNSDDAFGGDGQ